MEIISELYYQTHLSVQTHLPTLKAFLLCFLMPKVFFFKLWQESFLVFRNCCVCYI